MPLAWSSLSGQVEYNHPELQWQTIETPRFVVHFHQGVTRTARLVAEIAEQVYDPITSLYGYHPDTKIHFIVRDHEDNANGAAFYYDNKIEIWAPPADFLLRGDHAWLWNVVTHEFSHMISLGAARKFPRQVPAVYFQWLAYEKEKRKDVIHGYPHTLVSLPWAGTVVPMWFAEGMAQMQRLGMGHDTWDSHRDMLLRTAVLSGRLLSLSEMGIFGKNSLENEQVYNQGYGLTLYMAWRYGEDRIAALARALRSPLAVTFDAAARRVLGRSEETLYREWAAWLEASYRPAADSVDQYLIEGRLLEGEGIGNLYPAWSPDGKHLVYASNRGEDYLSRRALFIRDATGSASRKLVPGVTSSASFSPDGQSLVYATHVRRRDGHHYYDLFTLDLTTMKKKRVTTWRRARQPAWSPNGDRIVAVIEQDGTSNLALVRPDGKDFRVLTHFLNGEQLFTPRWMPDGRNLVFALFTGSGGRDIAVIDTSGEGFRYLLRTDHDTRDPWPTPDGRSLFYASDQGGIFNIRRLDLETGEDVQVTRVLGGAFMPAPHPKDGSLVYVLFTADGFKLARLDSIRTVASVPYVSPYHHLKNQSSPPVPLKTDRETTFDFSPRSYQPIYSKLSILPRVMIDFPGKLKLGAYFYGSDILEKTSLFGGMAVNGQWDSDVFAQLRYRRWTPTFFVELYQIRRHLTDPEYRYGFSLMGADVGADWKCAEVLALRTAYQFSRYDASVAIPMPGKDYTFSYNYHIGHTFQTHLSLDAVPPRLDSEIAPAAGRRVELELTANAPRFIEGFEVNRDYGTLIAKKRPYPYFQVMLDWREYLPFLIPTTSLALRFRVAAIDRPVEGFYHLFAGGLDGMRGYPYYGLEGTKLAHLGVTVRFPLWRKTGKRFAFFHVDNVYGALYGDIGNAWTESRLDGLHWKKDVGGQLRVALWHFYGYPLRLFVDGAYGFDRYTHEGVAYGKAWRWYFGVLFEFLD